MRNYSPKAANAQRLLFCNLIFPIQNLLLHPLILSNYRTLRMELKYFQRIAEKLNLALKQINNIHQLHSDGATIPFMARYRKEATGNLDEVVIGNVIEEIKYFDELEKRKETVIKTIESLGKLTPELKSRIEKSFNATELEDIYLPYKPKRKTRATTAIEKGLEPLAKIIFEQGLKNPDTEAAPIYQ